MTKYQCDSLVRPRLPVGGWWLLIGTHPEAVFQTHDNFRKEKDMNRNFFIVAVAMVLFCAGIAGAQEYPLLDIIANKVIQKYQQSSCEQLWQKKGQPESEREKEVIQMLQGDPQMRQIFINKVAAPIANKMFECGMIP
jgi:hypothetical protein